VSCQRCNSERIAHVGAKCDDRCSVTIGEADSHGDYVPRDMRIGGGDYIEFAYCLECGQVQGKFPVPKTALEDSEDDVDDEFNHSDVDEDEDD
jgi:hypothetical protein